MRSVRLFYTKTGMSKYISHLDLMRCFSRAVTRAKLDIWYTEGFNPHPYMTFSLPLSLGTESYCESVDIRMNDETPCEEIQDRLNSTLPVGIVITKCCEPVHKAEEIAFAEFNIQLNTNDVETVFNAVSTEIERNEIIVEKKGKQGKKKVLKPVDIKPNVIKYEITKGENKVKLNLILTAGTHNNINPSLLLGAITKEVEDKIESIDIVKNKIMLENMAEFQ